MRRIPIAALALYLPFASCMLPKVCAQQQNNSKQSQNVEVNNGTLNQSNSNITINNTTQRLLRKAARRDFGSEQGWLRTLVPANDPPIESKCEEDSAEMIVILGGGPVGSCRVDACEIIEDGNAGSAVKSLLSVKRKGKALQVSATIFDREGKIVFALQDNKPHVNRANVFSWNMKRDAHELDVTDQFGVRVLHIRYANERTVYIEGLFYRSQGPYESKKAVIQSVKIDPDGLLLMPAHITMRDGCSSTYHSVFSFEGTTGTLSRVNSF